MSELPDDFADSLSRVLDPRHREAAAEIIEAATMLDDVGLRHFLRLFAARVRASDSPIRSRMTCHRIEGSVSSSHSMTLIA